MSVGYQGVANILKGRILVLIPRHPEILEMREVSELFRIDEFDCTDLSPSLLQSQWAFAAAKHEWQAKPTVPEAEGE